MSLTPVFDSYDRCMADAPKFDFGDEVQLTDGEHKGRVGCIVSINLSAPSGTYTVEFDDGSDAEIKETLLSKAASQLDLLAILRRWFVTSCLESC